MRRRAPRARQPGPEPLLESGERLAGHLVLSNGGLQEELAVGGKALDRGIILGRCSRCTGDTIAFSDQVSRVHAMLLRVGGELHVIEAGSTNGTWLGDRELKCEPVV